MSSAASAVPPGSTNAPTPSDIIEAQYTYNELLSILRNPHIHNWWGENFVWPGLTAGIATVTYTITQFSSRVGDWSTFYIGGELIGAGGMLLVVVMCASAHSKRLEWIKIAAGCGNSGTSEIVKANLDNHRQELSSIGNWAPLLQNLSMAGAIGMAVIHVKTDHHMTDSYRMATSFFLLVGSVAYVYATATALRLCLLKAKIELFHLERHIAGKPLPAIDSLTHRRRL